MGSPRYGWAGLEAKRGGLVEDLLPEYVPRVYRYALRLTHDHHVAEDIVQETFLRAWRSRRRLRSPQSARVWLLRIATNVWRDRLRNQTRQDTGTRPLPDEVPGTVREPAKAMAERETLREVLRMMDSLPPRQQQVLYLSAIEAMRLDEIAQVLEINYPSAKASLSLARRAMRQQFSAFEQQG